MPLVLKTSFFFNKPITYLMTESDKVSPLENCFQLLLLLFVTVVDIGKIAIWVSTEQLLFNVFD